MPDIETVRSARMCGQISARPAAERQLQVWIADDALVAWLWSQLVKGVA